MSAEDRQAIIDEAAATVKKAEEDADAAVEKLQAEYEETQKTKTETIKATQTPELRLLKTIKGDAKDDL